MTTIWRAMVRFMKAALESPSARREQREIARRWAILEARRRPGYTFMDLPGGGYTVRRPGETFDEALRRAAS